MPRRVRDLIATTIVLLMLFAILLSINPRIRDRFTQIVSSGVNSQELGSARHAVDTTVVSATAIVSSYAADNVYLFALLAAGCVLLILMLRT